MDWTRTFIIGGGESAAGLDYELLRSRGVVVGVNVMGLIHPVDVFFSIDRDWCAEPEVLERIRALARGGEVAVHLCQKPEHNWPDIPGATIWKRVLGPPSQEPGVISTGYPQCAASGLSAINLAEQNGATDVYLSGFDMHDDYTYNYPDKDAVGRHDRAKPNVPAVRTNFAFHAEHYRGRLRIFNASAGSALHCFYPVTRDMMYGRP